LVVLRYFDKDPEWDKLNPLERERSLELTVCDQTPDEFEMLNISLDI